MLKEYKPHPPPPFLDTFFPSTSTHLKPHTPHIISHPPTPPPPLSPCSTDVGLGLHTRTLNCSISSKSTDLTTGLGYLRWSPHVHPSSVGNGITKTSNQPSTTSPLHPKKVNSSNVSLETWARDGPRLLDDSTAGVTMQSRTGGTVA